MHWWNCQWCRNCLHYNHSLQEVWHFSTDITLKDVVFGSFVWRSAAVTPAGGLFQQEFFRVLENSDQSHTSKAQITPHPGMRAAVCVTPPMFLKTHKHN
ncbi:hypothetical protein V8J88_08325 [Massilia sp. W12]|uniref:hypothetical protein n=1 Tax=Massilia sp. W12 TaxID=3126507 RepID=UPI0030D3DC24